MGTPLIVLPALDAMTPAFCPLLRHHQFAWHLPMYRTESAVVDSQGYQKGTLSSHASEAAGKT